jgi:transforming growth factor-beta-induced protein
MKTMNILLEKFSKYSLLLLLVSGLIVLGSCGDDDDGPGVDPDPDPTETIWEIVQNTAGLDSLEKYLTVYPDLVAALSTTPNKTLFAPNNQAFISLLQTPGFPANIASINPDIIKFVLSYHVVPGQTILKADLGADMTTLATGVQSAGDVIQVNTNGTLLTGSTNSEIEILTPDLKATNGVVHVIGSVMIPQSTGASLTPILGTVAGTVLLGANFSHLAALVMRADSDVPDGMPSIVQILANPDGTLTAFAPPNPVFEGAAAANEITVTQLINSFSPLEARTVLATHVVGTGIVASGDLTQGQELTSLSQTVITVTLTDPSEQVPLGVLVKTPETGQIPVFVADIEHSNGLVHVIGGILFPGE